MDWLSILKLVAGLATLLVGGEFLVKGAVNLAQRLKVSTLVIGMTVVSLGTSAPELLVSIKAAITGHPDIAIGNVVGSNIANIALVLGLTVIIFPLAIARQTIRLDWPLMMLASILFYILALDGTLQLWEGVLFVSLLAFAIWLMMRASKKQMREEDPEEGETGGKLWVAILFIAGGCIGLVLGADWLLQGAVEIAVNFAVPEHVIGVTIVAFGTSVPELATSLVAALRKQADISVGNLVGSNLFNILAILGITAIVKEVPVNDQVLSNDIFWMLAISLVLLPMMIVKNKIGRFSGALLLLAYVAYVLVTVQF